MPILHRLSLGQKFLILGLVALLMVMVPTDLYLQRAFADMALAKKQVQGGQALGALSRVLQLTQTHRGLSASMLSGNMFSGNDKLAQRLPGVRASLVQAMAGVDATLKSSAVSPQIASLWVERRQEWLVLAQRIDGWTLHADESTHLHTDLIAGQFLVGAAVMDEFGLSLDSWMDSRMLTQASVVNAVALTEHLGLMRARGAVYLTQGVIPAEGRPILQASQKQVMQVQAELFRNLAKAADANAAIKAGLAGQAQKLGEQISVSMALVEKELSSGRRLRMTPDVYFDELTRTIDGLYDFNTQAIQVLEHTLQARVNSAQQVAFGMLALLSLGVLMAGALAWAFVRSITLPVREAVAFARALADGDLSATVRVRGSNEIGRLMQSLTDMQTAQQQAREIESLRPFALELTASRMGSHQVLERLIQKLEQLLPTTLGAIWLLDPQSNRLHAGAAPGLSDLLEQARGDQRLEPDLLPAGQVSFSHADARDLELVDSPLRSTFNAMGKKTGLQACWSVPVLSGKGQVLGVWDLHLQQSDAPDAHARKLIDTVSYFAGQAIDRRAAEAQERLAAQVFSESHDAITITDANERIVMVNPAFSEITGFDASEVLDRNPSMLSSGRHDPAFYAAMWREIHAQGKWQGEIWNRRKSGEVYPEWLTISRLSNSFGEVTNYMAMFSDISQRKADEERMQWMANFDVLTGLPNRALLQDRFTHDVSVAQRGGSSLALMFMDLDHFKNVNDSLGHGIGDELLISVARRMRQQVREQDTVARLGGDEFVLLLPGTDADGAAHLAQKVLDAIAQPFQVGEHELMVTPSIGIAVYPQDGHDLASLAQHADVAMYRAKEDGRNAYRFFAPAMQLQSQRTLLLEGALRRALERDQLRLHYQPQLSLRTGRVIGVEALLRWNHPELGQVSPAEFIPVAEKSGLILPIGEWVLRTAVGQMVSWIHSGLEPIIMAVNISAVQFRQPNLPELVSHILAEAALAPEYLELELTEGVATDDPKGAIAIMGELRTRGVRMSIDDFGTGYSSLSYLKRFPVYKLKIDQSFVRDIVLDPEDKAIVDAIIGMASSLGLQTIAEGVETLEQLDALRAKGCDEVQGYFFSRPLLALDCERFLRLQLPVQVA